MRAAQDPCFRGVCQKILFGSWDILRSRASALGLTFDFKRISMDELEGGEPLPECSILDIPADRVVPGSGSRATGAAAARNIIECAAACSKGRLDAMVTAPLNKRFFQEAGYAFPGHTEFLAHLSGAPDFAMGFLTERLKVVLATIHIPLRAVADSITPGLVYNKLRLMLTEFPRMGLPCHKVAVAGINPHAGESGILGTEEACSLEPAIQQARDAFPVRPSMGLFLRTPFSGGPATANSMSFWRCITTRAWRPSNCWVSVKP
jgi:4-hydroxythreonine-4-phosphate dehydrogenase